MDLLDIAAMNQAPRLCAIQFKLQEPTIWLRRQKWDKCSFHSFPLLSQQTTPVWQLL